MSPALSALRAWLSQKQLDAFILPRGDAYLGEYVAPHDEMLAWLTGFTGSAGFAIVTQRIAYLYTDGRYQTQGAAELKNSGFELRHSSRDKWDEELAAAQTKGAIGFDPWLHNIEWHAAAEKKLATKNWKLIPVPNPTDGLWQNRPAHPVGQAEIHALKFAGESGAAKCERLGKKLAAQNAAAELVNDPTLVAWLLNLRGSDLPHTPIVQARAMLHASGRAELFIAPEKILAPVRAELDEHVSIRAPETLSDAIAALRSKTLRLPAAQTPYALLQIAEKAGAEIDTGSSIIVPARAIKNSTEQDGARAAHGCDAVALKNFFAELPTLISAGTTELEIAARLAHHRAQQPDYVSESFPAIIGWNGNGAIVHYRPPEHDSARIAGDGILLIDSGGQYRPGTTDVTRTVAVGTPTAYQKEVYTRVLKGHLAIARAQFPVGTTGGQLDALARQFLWEIGLDYDHGTGHGVGSFLNVHEGPQRITNRPDAVALESGMILSNEPGCYLPGEFGVRIENLVMVVPDAQKDLADGFLCFETLTLAPYDAALIDPALLTPAEAAQIAAYHARAKSIT